MMKAIVVLLVLCAVTATVAEEVAGPPAKKLMASASKPKAPKPLAKRPKPAAKPKKKVAPKMKKAAKTFSPVIVPKGSLRNGKTPATIAYNLERNRPVGYWNRKDNNKMLTDNSLPREMNGDQRTPRGLGKDKVGFPAPRGLQNVVPTIGQAFGPAFDTPTNQLAQPIAIFPNNPDWKDAHTHHFNEGHVHIHHHEHVRDAVYPPQHNSDLVKAIETTVDEHIRS